MVEATAVKLPPVLAYIMGAPVAPRHAVEATLQRAIDELDMLDGDPDVEENDAEDAFAFSYLALDFARGPGCISSDAPEVAWREGIDQSGRDTPPAHLDWGQRWNEGLRSEDDEDDDPGGGNVEDEGEMEDGVDSPRYGVDQTRGPINIGSAYTTWLRNQPGSGSK